MGDEQRGLARAHLVVFEVDVVLCNRVERRRRLVEQQHRPILIQSAGQHQPLGLAAGEQHAVLIDLPAHLGVNALGQRVDLLGQARLVQAGAHLVLIAAFDRLRDVFGHRRSQYRKFLKSGGEERVVVSAVKLADVLPVQQHRALGRVQQAAQELDQRGFARAVEAHNRPLLAGTDGEV